MHRAHAPLIASLLVGGMGCAEPTTIPIPSAMRGTAMWIASNWESPEAVIWQQQSLDEIWQSDGQVHLLEVQLSQPALPYERERSLRLVPGAASLPIQRAWRPVEKSGEVVWELDGDFDRERHGLDTVDPATCVAFGGCVVKNEQGVSECRSNCTMGLEIDEPRPPDADCLETWVTAGPAEAPLCLPPGWEAHTFVDCGAGEVDWGPVLGAPGVCSPVSECPVAEYLAPPPDAAFVDPAGLAGASGTRTDPFPSIEQALMVAETIVLAAGRYEVADEAVTTIEGHRLIGSCASEVTVSLDRTLSIDGGRVDLVGLSLAVPTREVGVLMESGELTARGTSFLGPIDQRGGDVSLEQSTVHAIGLAVADRALLRTAGSFTASTTAFLGRIMAEGAQAGQASDLFLDHVLVRGSTTSSPDAPGPGIRIIDGARAQISNTRVHWFYGDGIQVHGGQLNLQDALIWTSAGNGVSFGGGADGLPWLPSIIERVGAMRASVPVERNLVGLFIAGAGEVAVRHFGTDAFHNGLKVDDAATAAIDQSWLGFGGNRGINISPGAAEVEGNDLVVSSTYDDGPAARAIDNFFGVTASADISRLSRLKIWPGGRHGLQFSAGRATLEDIQIVGPHAIAVVAESGGSLVDRISTKEFGRGPSLDPLTINGTTMITNAHFRVMRNPVVTFAHGDYEVSDFVWEGCFEENDLDVQTLKLTRGRVVLEPDCRIRPEIFQLMNDVRLTSRRP